MAGVALSQIDNVSPNLGQGYIIDSFLVVVFGGVGNLWGTAVGALSLGLVNKFLEPLSGAVLGKIVVLVLAHLVHPAPAARPVPAQGQGGRGMTSLSPRVTWLAVVLVLAIAGAMAALNLMLPPENGDARTHLRRFR